MPRNVMLEWPGASRSNLKLGICRGWKYVGKSRLRVHLVKRGQRQYFTGKIDNSPQCCRYLPCFMPTLYLSSNATRKPSGLVGATLRYRTLSQTCFDDAHSKTPQTRYPAYYYYIRRPSSHNLRSTAREIYRTSVSYICD